MLDKFLFPGSEDVRDARLVVHTPRLVWTEMEHDSREFDRKRSMGLRKEIWVCVTIVIRYDFKLMDL